MLADLTRNRATEERSIFIGKYNCFFCPTSYVIFLVKRIESCSGYHVNIFLTHYLFGLFKGGELRRIVNKLYLWTLLVHPEKLSFCVKSTHLHRNVYEHLC